MYTGFRKANPHREVSGKGFLQDLIAGYGNSTFLGVTSHDLYRMLAWDIRTSSTIYFRKNRGISANLCVIQDVSPTRAGYKPRT